MTYTTLRLNYRLAGYWIQSNSAHFSDYKLETADQGGAVVYAHFQQQRINSPKRIYNFLEKNIP